MKKQRVKILIVTTVVFISALITTVLFVREINIQAEQLKEQVTTLNKDRVQQSQLAKLKKITTESSEDRELLSSYYLESQSDSIDFLNYIERLANEQSIELNTGGVTEVEEANRQRLVVRYTLGGDRVRVESFIKLLENIPYVSAVTSVQLTKQSEIVWQAGVTVEVVILEKHDV